MVMTTVMLVKAARKDYVATLMKTATLVETACSSLKCPLHWCHADDGVVTEPGDLQPL